MFGITLTALNTQSFNVFLNFFIWDKLSTRNSVPLNKQNYIAPKRNEQKTWRYAIFSDLEFPFTLHLRYESFRYIKGSIHLYRGMRPSNAIQFK